MAEMTEIGDALSVLQRVGIARELVTVLHCTTDYPASLSDVNLTAMNAIGREFGVAFGYSDHTLGIEASVAAVALGASVIEKHFTLDRELPGPDHQASLEPSELAAMVQSIRKVEAALGDGHKCPVESELRNLVHTRRSIVAARRIRAGELFDDSNICAKRPATGLSPMRWDDVVGRRASRDFDIDEMIEL
jgi:sialic acid synthase SpsE